MTTSYWALIEPTMGESDDKPGGLFRIRDDGQGQFAELLVGSGEWRDQPSLARYFINGDMGASPIDRGRAAQLIATYPWDGSRALTTGEKIDAKDFDEGKHPRDDHGRFATGDSELGDGTGVIVTPEMLAEARAGNLAGAMGHGRDDLAKDTPASRAFVASTLNELPEEWLVIPLDPDGYGPNTDMPNESELAKEAARANPMLGATIDSWTGGSYATIGPASHDILEGKPSEPDDASGYYLRYQAGMLMDTIDKAPANSPDTWRGMTDIGTNDGRFKDFLTVGNTVDLPLSSFSANQEYAQHQGIPQLGGGGGTGIVLHMEDGAQALHVAPFTSFTVDGEDEWLTQGRFQVESVDNHAGVYYVDVKQLDTFDVDELAKKSLHPSEYTPLPASVREQLAGFPHAGTKDFDPDKHPRDERGRFGETGGGGGSAEADRAMADAVSALEAPGLISPGRMATTSPSIEAWKQQYGAPAEEYARIMHDWTDRNMGMLQRTVPERSTDAGRRVADLLDHAPTIDVPLFRSAGLPDLSKGTFALPPSSFTTIAGVTDFTAKGAEKANAIIEVQPGSRGLPIGALSKYPEEHEIMEAGSYRIISTDERTASIYGRDVPYTHVLVEQLPEAKITRSWWHPGRAYTPTELAMAGSFAETRAETKDFDPGLHPRDDHGKFAVNGGGAPSSGTQVGRALADIATSHHWGNPDPDPAHDDRPFHMRSHEQTRDDGRRWGHTTMSADEFNSVQDEAIRRLDEAGLDGKAIQQTVAGWSYGADVPIWRDYWNGEPEAQDWVEQAGPPFSIGLPEVQNLMRMDEINAPLYRGLSVTPEVRDEIAKPGTVIPTLGPASWSRDPVVADVFANTSEARGADMTERVILQGSGFHGIDSAPLGDMQHAWQSEVIVGQDSVRVTKVENVEGRTVLTVEPV